MLPNVFCSWFCAVIIACYQLLLLPQEEQRQIHDTVWHLQPLVRAPVVTLRERRVIDRLAGIMAAACTFLQATPRSSKIRSALPFVVAVLI